MATTFHGTKPWAALTSVCKDPGRRYAAVAFVGEAAPTLMPLKRNDVLILNADKAALKSHATSPSALQRYYDRGVQLYDDDALHAKVIVSSRRAVVGSANASTNSTRLDEAALVTDSPTLVAEARRFVEELAASLRRMDQTDIDRAEAIYKTGRGRCAPPGTDAAGQLPSRSFPAESNPRMFVIDDRHDPATPAELKAVDRTRRSARRHAGPVKEFVVEPLLWSVDYKPALREGDLLVWVEPDDDPTRRLVQLYEVDCDPIKASARTANCWLRRPSIYQAKPLSVVNEALMSAGFAAGLGKLDRQIRDRELKAAVTRLWHQVPHRRQRAPQPAESRATS